MIYAVIVLSVVVVFLAVLIWFMLPYKEEAKLYKERGEILQKMNDTCLDRLTRLCDINDKAIEISKKYSSILSSVLDKLSEIEIKMEKEEDDAK